MKIRTITTLFGAFAIGILASCDDTKDTSKGTGKFESAPGKVTGKTFKINETVSLPDSEWAVLKAKDLGSTLKGNEDEGTEEKTTEGKFIYVQFRMTNKTKGSEQIIFTPTLQDGAVHFSVNLIEARRAG